MVTTAEPAQRRIAQALVRLAHAVQQVFSEVSREHELTPQQAQLLCLLIDGPVGMTDLSRALHLERSSLSGLVDRAERRGLVARARDSRDRRACRIELTGEGARVAALAHDAVTARLETLTAGLPPGHHDLLAATLDDLLSRPAPPEP
ncbi:MarR family winged helix-turn-helix transcriptional regulator [Nonomuraea pusilla]|uniref:MarR family winged helix-turn-helix transcriptional regulator n=1 Tax=Nonomuraea pusilla TaxID=46177 RepID=UPI003325E98B